MLDQQLTKIATEGKARMPGSGMSLPSCFERMTAMDAARNEQFAFWLDTGEVPRVGIQTGAFWFWKKSGTNPNPNITSYCLAVGTTWQAVTLAGGVRTYWAWLYAQRREFCGERGIDEATIFNDERAEQFRKWLRLRAMEAAQ